MTTDATMAIESGVVWLPLERLLAHPLNSNAMPDAMADKLAAHIERSGRYPPLIVRPASAERIPSLRADGELESGPWYELLDGHHRAAVLRRLGHERASCVVWEVDDAEATMLLATLNRLEGRDDPAKRAELLRALRDRWGDAAAMKRWLPERAEMVDRLLAMPTEPPRPARPPARDEMPVAVTFFLLPPDKAVLDARLRAAGGSREAALMRMVCGEEPSGSEVQDG